jgi:hypothetical protein
VEGRERHHEALRGGRGTDSSPGTFHSTAAVSGGSWPTLTRRRSCSRGTLERVQFDIAAVESWAGWKHKERWHHECGRTRSAEGKCKWKKKMGRQSPKPAPDTRF